MDKKLLMIAIVAVAAIIAAGAVVHEDIPDNCLVGGVPAIKIKDLVNDVQE